MGKGLIHLKGTSKNVRSGLRFLNIAIGFCFSLKTNIMNRCIYYVRTLFRTYPIFRGMHIGNFKICIACLLITVHHQFIVCRTAVSIGTYFILFKEEKGKKQQLSSIPNRQM